MPTAMEAYVIRTRTQLCQAPRGCRESPSPNDDSEGVDEHHEVPAYYDVDDDADGEPRSNSDGNKVTHS